MKVYARYIDLNEKEDEIPPIEIGVYMAVEGKKYMHYSHNRSIGEIFQELKKRLEKDRFLPEEYFNIAPWQSAEKEFPQWRWIACYAVTGCSEGHYIHVDVIASGGERNLLFLGKTFQGKSFATKVALACTMHLPT